MPTARVLYGSRRNLRRAADDALEDAGSAPPTDMRWRILRDGGGSGAWNMAVDEALARTLRSGEGVLRIYEWSRPTLSFGRNQPARERYRSIPFGEMDLDLVRRPTGGREVLHDREVTYSVVAPLHVAGTPRDLYRRVSHALVEGLVSLGVPARLSSSASRAALGSGPCFAAPGDGEVEVDGRKLVGSAQARLGRSLLQHGSIPLHPPPSNALGFAFGGIAVADLLPTGSAGAPFNRVAIALEEAVSAALSGSWRRGCLRRAESEVANALLPYYESPSWTWRK